MWLRAKAARVHIAVLAFAPSGGQWCWIRREESLIDTLKLKRASSVAPQRREPASCRHCRLSASAELPKVSQRRTWVSWRRPAVHVGAHSYRIWRKSHPLLCPHDRFRSLFRERPRLWEPSLRSDVGAAERNWDELQESEVLRDHPELLTTDKGWFIPCGLHGDAGQLQSHGHQLQLADRLWGYEEPTVCKKSDMRPGTLDSLFGRDCLVLQRAADCHRASGGLGEQRPDV